MEVAPDWFIEEMRSFDSELRLRWSEKVHLWQLERRITHGVPINTSKKDGFDDDFIRARDGYLLVAMIESGKFSRTIFEELRKSDLWSNGGWEEYIRLIEDIEAREEEAKWRAFDEDIRYACREVYDFLAARDGRKVFLGRASV
jgi:hypothetical protein